MDKRFLNTPDVSKLIKNIRGKSLTTALIGNVIFLVVVYNIWILGTQGGFTAPSQNPGW